MVGIDGISLNKEQADQHAIALEKLTTVETVCLPDWYDPSIATKDEYLGKRQHEKSAEEKEKSLQDSIRKSWYW